MKLCLTLIKIIVKYNDKLWLSYSTKTLIERGFIMANLALKNIYKIYSGGVTAVSDFCLDIEDKEFVVFVGPSGCGKSTTLRMIAGLEEISSGQLYIGDRLVNDVEPKDRDIAMVFQNYALYPHMSVYDNMAFGLKIRKVSPLEIEKRVKEAAKVLHIEHLLDRKPKALSGGQRQRVALGRALVRYPKVFLLDEPLSNLDAKLRVAMRTEITKLHKKLGTTFIYVTHDQVEAMTMGTRIVVMKDGLIQQVDTPQNLYDSPQNLFVATFIGTPQMNIFSAKLEVDNSDNMYCKIGEYKIAIPGHRAKRLVSDEYIGNEIWFGIRPEDIHDEEIFVAHNTDTLIEVRVDNIEKLGSESIIYFRIEGKDDYAIARVNARSTVEIGDTIKLGVDTRHGHFFDKDTGLSIMGVPKINLLNAQCKKQNEEILKEEKEKNKICLYDSYQIHLLGKEFLLPNSIKERLVDNLAENITIGIHPCDWITENQYKNLGNQQNYVGIHVTVDFVENKSDKTILFCKVESHKGLLVAKVSKNSQNVEGNITLYFDIEKIQLYDTISGDKLLACRPLGNNEISANITNKEGINIAWGDTSKNKWTQLPIKNISSNIKQIYVDHKGIVVGKKNIQQYPKTKTKATVVAIDVLGAKSVLYCKINGVKNELVAIVDGILTYKKDEKINIAVDYNAIK